MTNSSESIALEKCCLKFDKIFYSEIILYTNGIDFFRK